MIFLTSKSLALDQHAKQYEAFRRHGEQLVMPHATTFQAQLCNQTQGLALHRQYSEQTLKISYISQHSCDYASQQSKYLLLN